jgi:acyl dehydratase
VTADVGGSLPTLIVPITRADLVRYAGASGDFNPIHWSESTARTAGLPDVIAHGMATMGFAVQAITDLFADPRSITDYGVRFMRPVVVADSAVVELLVESQVTVVRPDGSVGIALTGTVDGQTVIRGSISITADGARSIPTSQP